MTEKKNQTEKLPDAQASPEDGTTSPESVTESLQTIEVISQHQQERFLSNRFPGTIYRMPEAFLRRLDGE